MAVEPCRCTVTFNKDMPIAPVDDGENNKERWATFQPNYDPDPPKCKGEKGANAKCGGDKPAPTYKWDISANPSGSATFEGADDIEIVKVHYEKGTKPIVTLTVTVLKECITAFGSNGSIRVTTKCNGSGSYTFSLT